MGLKMSCDSSTPRRKIGSQWLEFLPTEYSSKYGDKQGDVLGRSGMLYCRRCPSCLSTAAQPYMLDAQCHMVPVADHGFFRADYVRFGDWADVACSQCKKTAKFKNWYCEDLKLRPRETVFHDGSTCFSFRQKGCSTLLYVFVSRARKRDGVLIWKKEGDTMSVSARNTCADFGFYSTSNPHLAEKVLDMPYLEYVKHNEKVRTRNEAARSALASL